MGARLDTSRPPDPGLDDERSRDDTQRLIAPEGELIALQAPAHHEVFAVVSVVDKGGTDETERAGARRGCERVLLCLSDTAPVEGQAELTPVLRVVLARL